MLIRIPAILGQRDLEFIVSRLQHAHYVDGKLSAGASARQVKNNQELSADEHMLAELNSRLMGNLVRHPVYKNAALPLRIAAPFYARYTQGMHYGSHIDDPVMGIGDLYRSDIAITVFLNSPEDYDGGELSIQTAFGEQNVKFTAGDGVLYPASSRHCVTEVTRGERLVAVTWVQSMIRDPEKRSLLYELNLAREKLLRKSPGTKEAQQVDNAYVNLVRMWAEV